VNYANPDMVGHTGVWPATVRAVEVVDACLARIVDAVEAVSSEDPSGPGAALLITADHGNADELRDAAGNPVTAHSLNPVPIVAIGPALVGATLHDGVLADVAPTILALAGQPRWPGMTGRSLLGGDPVLPSVAAPTEDLHP
jgi:2,3-bisphosphoglycerate-independent phosphoglycerate mutase